MFVEGAALGSSISQSVLIEKICETSENYRPVIII
jgi:hypothetical protein